ncbi:hypothetical protein [Neobacillus sp. 19]
MASALGKIKAGNNQVVFNLYSKQPNDSTERLGHNTYEKIF